MYTLQGKILPINSFNNLAESQLVYNISVANLHNYFIGENDVLVHNAACSMAKLQRIATAAHEKLGPPGSRAYNSTTIAATEVKHNNRLTVLISRNGNRDYPAVYLDELRQEFPGV